MNNFKEKKNNNNNNSNNNNNIYQLTTNGINENALGCNSFSGTISATNVLIVPTFPFKTPAIHLATIACGSDFEKPKSNDDISVPTSPNSKTGFRPNRSLARPQKTPLVNWEKAKLADVTPTQNAIRSSGTPKDLIIKYC